MFVPVNVNLESQTSVRFLTLCWLLPVLQRSHVQAPEPVDVPGDMLWGTRHSGRGKVVFPVPLQRVSGQDTFISRAPPKWVSLSKMVKSSP